MPDIRGTHDGSQVFLPVLLQPIYPKVTRPDSFSMSDPVRLEYLRGLIDTGAQRTSITPQAAKKLGLTPTGQVRIQGVGGAKPHLLYLFKLGFVDLRKNEIGSIAPHSFFVEKIIEGPEFDCGPEPYFDILIGMDLLSVCDLTIKRDGNFLISF
jgi:hypothetical protein